jgi:hypothetical protein
MVPCANLNLHSIPFAPDDASPMHVREKFPEPRVLQQYAKSVSHVRRDQVHEIYFEADGIRFA